MVGKSESSKDERLEGSSGLEPGWGGGGAGGMKGISRVGQEKIPMNGSSPWDGPLGPTDGTLALFVNIYFHTD